MYRRIITLHELIYHIYFVILLNKIFFYLYKKLFIFKVKKCGTIILKAMEIKQWNSTMMIFCNNDLEHSINKCYM